MVNRDKPLALKPYLEAVEAHCRQLSGEQLVELVLSLARNEYSRHSAFRREVKQVISESMLLRKIITSF